MVITEMSMFPHGVSMTISPTRPSRRSNTYADIGFAQDEAREGENRSMMHRLRPKSLYPMLGPRC
jgi:hypothetical protein